MTESASPRRAMRTVRLNAERIAELLDRLDQQDAVHGDERESRRFRYRMKAVVVHLKQNPGVEAQSYIAPSRDLSAGGFSFLHGGYVHSGTACLAQLITSLGHWHNVVGKVVGCRHVEGNIHVVALRFEQQIDPSVYCLEAAHSQVLLAEDDAAIARMAMFHLDKLNAVVEHVKDGRAAVDLALEKPYDVILMDMEMPVLNGFDAVRELRARGYRGLIVAVTAMTREGDRERCLAIGCDRYLAKPFSRDDLASVLHTLHEDPLFSTLAYDLDAAELVSEYVSELPARIRAIEEAAIANDQRELVSLARLMKGQGALYGFEIISEAAERIEAALLEGLPIEALRADVDDLLRLCTRAHTSARIADPGGQA